MKLADDLSSDIKFMKTSQRECTLTMAGIWKTQEDFAKNNYAAEPLLVYDMPAHAQDPCVVSVTVLRRLNEDGPHLW